jgi:hypothetical protein
MNPLLTTCPVCGEALHVTRLECDACHTAIEGRFTLDASDVCRASNWSSLNCC